MAPAKKTAKKKASKRKPTTASSMKRKGPAKRGPGRPRKDATTAA